MANGRPRAITRLGVLALAVACLVAVVPGGRADDPDALRNAARGLATSERQAALRLFAAESAAARARRQVALLERRVRALDAQVRASRRHRAVVRVSLTASRARVAETLRLLYVEGSPPDALAAILGAGSLEDAVEALDGLRRAAAQNRRLGEQAVRREAALRAVTARLGSRSAALRASRDEAGAALRTFELVAADRRRTLVAVRERLGLTERRLAAALAEAQAAVRRSAAVEAAREPAAAVEADETARADLPGGAGDVAGVTPAALRAGDGTSSLTVRATAYSLTGRTASGLPTGPGVVAVDPSVIPLGTRLHVPGYGEAVAADTGGAVHGAVIDVWLPSRAEALGWGVRTVTITIYRS